MTNPPETAPGEPTPGEPTPADPIPADPTQHYDSVVEAWAHLLGEDLHYGFFESGDEPLVAATNALTDQMLSEAMLQKGLSVLDIGCGTGKAGCRIARESACQLIGISPSTRCIEDATELAFRLGLSDSAHFRIGDGTRPDFAGESFDRVWIMESSHLMDDKAALIREAARVLKPGGRLVLCDIMLDHKLSLEQVIDYRDEFLLLRDVFGRAKMEPLSFYDEQLQANKLKVANSRDITRETFATFDRWRQNAKQNQTSVAGLIGEVAWQQFADSCDVLEAFWQRGILGYGLVSAVKPS
ncbi:MAG: methyltransferase domain-containing protein [Halioglobus sp.]